MRPVSFWCILVLSLPSSGQAGSDFRISPAVGTDQQRSVAVLAVVSGFNGIGLRGADLRHAMKTEDAEAFDAVMLDLMGALIAVPSFGLAGSGDATKIAPRKPRYDRIPQIGPELLALDKFFARLQVCSLPAEARIFADARKNVRKMLSALPIVLPTISAK